MTKRMTSVEFRMSLPRIDEVTQVTLQGRRIGIYVPEDMVDGLPKEWTRYTVGHRSYTADIRSDEVTKR